MSKFYETKLGRALKLNYWTVSEAMQYICAVKPTQIPEIGHLAKTSDPTNTPSPSQAQEKISSLTRYWYDTDHTTPPRESTGPANDRSAEYPVRYFIQWAVSKEIKIHWLNDAIKNGFLPVNINDRAHVATTVAPLLHHKKERTYLLIIAALLNKQGIDWTKRTANGEIRKLIDEIQEKAGKDAVGTVLKELCTDEQLESIFNALRNKI